MEVQQAFGAKYGKDAAQAWEREDAASAEKLPKLQPEQQKAVGTAFSKMREMAESHGVHKPAIVDRIAEMEQLLARYGQAAREKKRFRDAENFLHCSCSL